MSSRDSFTFKISLSVLNHLGRNLYRSFATVLGEAISNSWDADATNVWVYIDKPGKSFIIKDDGDGMTASDFQDKFLKIGYSKRKDGKSRSKKNRPFIGRKGIGKLALLSCADRITVVTRALGSDYVGGVIDNAGLNDAITEDLTPQEYQLQDADLADFKGYTKNHRHGTIIYFHNMKEGIRNSLEYIRKIIALYFRFSLIDKSFKIFVDDEQITLDDLDDLADRSQFLWIINDLKDPFIRRKLIYSKNNRKDGTNLIERGKQIRVKAPVTGFIASVRKPTDLKILGTDERVGVDLFVNGRLRERDIFRHIPTARIVESYLYGQVHSNGLDDAKDRFSSSREGIVADDEKFSDLLEHLKRVLATIISDWDKLRIKHQQDGDPDNPIIPKKERKAGELYNVVSQEFEIPVDPNKPQLSQMVDRWVGDLAGDATHSFSSYAECFTSENLVRKHIAAKRLPLSKEAKKRVREMKEKERTNKNTGNVSIEIRRSPVATSYLSMDDLANLVDKPQDRIKKASISRDAEQYKPIRDALMHTALLTDEAKSKLTTVSQNITARVKTLLSNE
jgi:hypothetical protein